MKLNAEIAGHKYAVELRREDARVFANVDDRRYEIEVHESSDGYLLVHDGRVFNGHVDGGAQAGQPLQVVIGTSNYAVTITDPKRLRGSGNTGAHADGVVRIVAPMPGKVVRVLVEKGQQIDAGAGVVVVEAMKMQNELKSPKAGLVVTLSAAAGTTVNAGDVLAVVE